MRITTGETVYELIQSIDHNNNFVVPATFNSSVFINGVLNNTVTLNITLSDSNTGMYSASFSANTLGVHQFRVLNNNTGVIYISDSYEVSPNNQVNPSPTIYVGL